MGAWRLLRAAGAGVCLVALAGAGPLPGAAGTAALAERGRPQGGPSPVPAAGVYLSNGTSLQAVWTARSQGLSQLRWAGRWGTNLLAQDRLQVTEAAGPRLRPLTLHPRAWLDPQGLLDVVSGSDRTLRLVQRTALVPGLPLAVSCLTVTDAGTRPVALAVWDRVALPAAASRRRGTYPVGPLGPAALGVREGPPGNAVLFLATGPGALGSRGSLALGQNLRLAPGQSRQVTFLLGAASSLAQARRMLSQARSVPGSVWLARTAAAWVRWLDQGLRLSGGRAWFEPVLAENLLVLKEAQNPGTGLLPAQLNPALSGSTAVTQDAILAAIAFQMAGHLPEAARIWRFLSTHQGAGGTWPYAFNLWTGVPVSTDRLPAVSDSGAYLLGVAQYASLAGGPARVPLPWAAVVRAADAVASGVRPGGLAAADGGPWNAGLSTWTASQAWDLAGLWAAEHLALSQGAAGRQDLARWAAAATALQEGLQTPYSAPTPGLWNDTTGYYLAGETLASAPLIPPDGSTELLFALGVVSGASARAARTAWNLQQALGHLGPGLARFPGDGRFTSGTPRTVEPVWPALTLQAAMAQAYLGNGRTAWRDLAWYRAVSGADAMPPGLMVSRRTGRPASRDLGTPSVAAWAVIATATAAGAADLRVLPAVTASGAWAPGPLVGPGTQAAWAAVPYHRGGFLYPVRGPAAAVQRLYLANGPEQLDLRLDLGRVPPSALTVYLQGLGPSAGRGAARERGLAGEALGVPARLAVRWSPRRGGPTLFGAGGGGWRPLRGTAAAGLRLFRPSLQVQELAIPLRLLRPLGESPPAVGATTGVEVEALPARGGEDAALVSHYRWSGPASPAIAGQVAGQELYWVEPSRDRYLPGQPVRLTVWVVNPQAEPLVGRLEVRADHLGAAVGRPLQDPVHLPPGGRGRYTFLWRPPAADDRGYLVQVDLLGHGGVSLDAVTTAVNVASSWATFPRYGFVTRFGDVSPDTPRWTLALLGQYHLNALMFYDWQWRHDRPVAGSPAHPAASWLNISGTPVYGRTVQGLIQAAHRRGILAFNYNLVYGAWAGYLKRDPGASRAWGLYTAPGCRDPVQDAMPSGWQTPAIEVMNPGSPAWQAYLMAQERAAVTAYRFDGWQMDQLGDLGPVLSCAGQPVNLPAAFRALVVRAHRALPGVHLVFNAVGGYGAAQVLAPPSPLDVAYTEAWPADGQMTYLDLAHTVWQDEAASGGRLKAVLAAYMDPNLGNLHSNLSPGFFSAPGVLLTDAAIFAAGGDHLELGGENEMLDSPYFPNQDLRMSGSLQRAMASEYTFVTAYENLLQDRGGPMTLSATVAGIPTSRDGQGGTIWSFGRAVDGDLVVQFINLLGQSLVTWQDPDGTAPAPPLRRNLSASLVLPPGAQPVQVWLASPDRAGGAAQLLPFTVHREGGRRVLQVRLPALQVWDMVWIRLRPEGRGGSRRPGRR